MRVSKYPESAWSPNDMKASSITLMVASLLLGLLCFALPLNTERLVLIFLVAGFGGALCTYRYAAPSLRAISLEKSALLGASVGLIGGLIAIVATVLGLWKSDNLDVIFNSSSLNFAAVRVIKLALASGAGGLTVGLLSRVRFRPAVVKEE